MSEKILKGINFPGLEGTYMIPVGSENSVLYTEQELTEEEKAQARENIGAVGGMVITFGDDLNCSHSDDQIISALKSGLPVLYVRFRDEGYSFDIAISSGTVRWETDPLGEWFTLYAGNELALFYDAEGGTEGWVEYHESGGGGGGGGSVEGAVLYNDWQDLTPEEQAQARENIGAADAETIGDISTALAGTVKSVNGQTPDENGNVKIETGNANLDLILTDIPLVEGNFINSSGGSPANAAWSATDYIQVKDLPITPTIYYNIAAFNLSYIGLYDSRKVPISTIHLTDNTSIEVVEGVLTEANFGNAYYIRLCSLTSYESKRVAYGKAVLNHSSVTEDYLANGAVTEDKIAASSVSVEKIGFLTHLQGTNLINKRRLLANSYVNANGQVATYKGFFLTDYIKLHEGMDYYHSGIFKGYYAFYDGELNVISAHGDDKSLTSPFRVPAGTVYGRFTMINETNAQAAWIHNDSIKPAEYGYALEGVGADTGSKPTDYDGDDICVFSKGICIGDSLTQGTMNHRENGEEKYVNIAEYSYPTILTKLTGIPFDNKGLGGKTSDEWYSAESSSDLSGYDIAIIQLGVNDSIRYSGWTDSSVTGFTNIINKLKTENPKIKIFVATIMPAISYKGTAIDSVSQGIRDIVASLNDDDVILLDMAKHGHTGESEAFNCGHLSAYGYWRLAKDYKAYISWYMSNHKKQFREVQFIGTDYVYSAT